MIVLDKRNLDSKIWMFYPHSQALMFITYWNYSILPEIIYNLSRTTWIACLYLAWTSVYSFPDEPQSPDKTIITLITLGDMWDPNRVHYSVLVWLLSPHYFTCINTVTLIALTSTTPKQSEPWKREKMWWKNKQTEKREQKENTNHNSSHAEIVHYMRKTWRKR